MTDNIFIRHNSLLQKIEQDDIRYITADGNYCIVNTMDGKKFAVKISLTAFAEKLNPANFAQVHRGYIVKLDLVETIDTVNGAIMINGMEIPFGRKFRDSLLNQKINVI